MFGGIVYGLVGLVPTVAGFWKFMLTLVLFNLTTASVVLWLSIAFDSVSVASLVGTLVMLFKYDFLSWSYAAWLTNSAVCYSRACLSIGKLLRLRYNGSIRYLSFMLHLKPLL